MSIKIALAGNPNSGKTTLFNALTGSNQFVGNWPGVTVEKKEGKLKGNKDVVIMDLPGIYSLSPYTLEEVLARNYLISERPDAILNIVDGTNIERNLYLSTQLMELGIPVIIAVNMTDILKKSGDIIDIEKLSKKLGCQIVEISALKGTGIQKAVERVVSLVKEKNITVQVHKFDARVELVISAVEAKLREDIPNEQKRFVSIKLLERDDKIIDQMKYVPDVTMEINMLEDEFDDDVESIITNERYMYITAVVKECMSITNKNNLSTSDKIDKIVTNRWLALPIFAVIMFLVYFISVTTVGAWATDWANDGVFGDGWSAFGFDIPGVPTFIGRALESVGCAQWLQGLILGGIISGVGAVLGFVPQMLVLFIMLAVLETCGYMARVAFIMDKIFRKFGLSGRSFIPMMVGSGCGVPGIMASRTIENDRDRKMTIMTTTFIPCGAKIPIIALVAGAIFNGEWWVAPSAYFIGIIAIICSGIILKKTKMFSSDPSPFVIELPSYHMPTIGTVLRSMWERGWSFIKKAGTIILLSTVVLWFLMSFGWYDGAFGMLEEQQLNNSILALIGGAIAPIFAPLGWGDWIPAVAAVTGLIAKENVVGTFGILYGFAEVGGNGVEIWSSLAQSMTALSAYSFLAFNLLCAPCFAAMGAIRREMNNTKWFCFAIAYQTILAYLVSLCIFQVGTLITQGKFGVGTIVAFIIITGFIYMLFKPYRESTTLKINIKNTVSAK